MSTSIKTIEQIEPITAAAIVALCRHPAAAALTIEVVQQTGSTNADLLARIGAAASQSVLRGPTARLALQQTAGRGRAGRSWQSDAASLTFSLAWRFDLPVTALLGLPLAVGVAVADVLAARGAPVMLKWPNDILLNGGKLAGILIETNGGGGLLQESAWAVIGIGLNLDDGSDGGGAAAQAGNHRPPPATGAMPIARLPATERNCLVAELLDALATALAQFARHGLAPFVVRWNARHAHAGLPVDIIDRTAAAQSAVLHTGTALGIDAVGRLLLQTQQGVVPIVAGDVSLRPSLRPRAEVRHAAVD